MRVSRMVPNPLPFDGDGVVDRIRIGHSSISGSHFGLWVAAAASFSGKKIGRLIDSYTEGHAGSPGCDRWTRFLDNLEKSGLLTELYR